MKQKIKKLICQMIPKRNIILFESNPDFADNTYWLFKHFADNKLFENFKFVWLLADYSKRRKELEGKKITSVDLTGRGIFKKIRRTYYRIAAKVIIDCNRFIPKMTDKQIRIHLGHGMPMKRAQSYFECIGKCDFLPLMGEGFRWIYNQFGYESELVSCGYPRNEILVKNTDSISKYIVWLPTFRQHVRGLTMDNQFPLGIPAIKSVEEFEKINELLGRKNYKLLLRLHPMQDLSIIDVTSAENILIADDDYLNKNDITLYELLSKASALITDYSSVYYDFLLTGRPIGLTLEDCIEYAKHHGLYFDNIREELPGFLIDSCDDLENFIKSVCICQDEFLEKRVQFAEKLGIKPLDASAYIANYLRDNLYGH